MTIDMHNTTWSELYITLSSWIHMTRYVTSLSSLL